MTEINLRVCKSIETSTFDQVQNMFYTTKVWDDEKIDEVMRKTNTFVIKTILKKSGYVFDLLQNTYNKGDYDTKYCYIYLVFKVENNEVIKIIYGPFMKIEDMNCSYMYIFKVYKRVYNKMKTLYPLNGFDLTDKKNHRSSYFLEPEWQKQFRSG